MSKQRFAASVNIFALILTVEFPAYTKEKTFY